ncbi:hypothetical protein [Intrasporangium mesophilum]
MNLRTSAITVIAMTSLAIPAGASAMPPLPDPPVSSLDSGPTTSDHTGDGRCQVTAQASGESGSTTGADRTYRVSGAGSAAAAERYIQDCQMPKTDPATTLVALLTEAYRGAPLAEKRRIHNDIVLILNIGMSGVL